MLNWKLEQSNGRDGLTVQNSGQRHIRLAALSLRDGNGQTVQVAAGLAGYVLAGSTMRFALPPTVRKLSTARLTVSAQSDVGPIDVILPKPSN